MSAKSKAGKYITAIDECELAARMLEAIDCIERPHDKDVMQFLLSIDDGKREALHRASRAALNYWRECIQNLQRVS